MRNGHTDPANDDGQAGVDRLLAEAGARWRASQRAPRPMDAGWFADLEQPLKPTFRWRTPWSIAAAAASVLLLATLIGSRVPDPIRPAPDSGSGGTPSEPAAAAPRSCPITKPVPPFDAPVPVALEPGVAWFGSAEMWTRLGLQGDVWTDLPRRGPALVRETYWWHAPAPTTGDRPDELWVTGRRLDGRASFRAGAGADVLTAHGLALRVEVEIPSGGCWEVTGALGGASLTYVVWVEE